MKFRALLLAMALCSLSPGMAAAERGSDPADNGRYQLFQGTYTTFDLKRQETYTHNAVFLIDTKTGLVKRYVNKIDADGKYIEAWLPTELSQDKQGK